MEYAQFVEKEIFFSSSYYDFIKKDNFDITKLIEQIFAGNYNHNYISIYIYYLKNKIYKDNAKEDFEYLIKEYCLLLNVSFFIKTKKL